MEGFDNPAYLATWFISNVVALLILWAAIRKPRIARWMFFLLFGWACWMNYTTAHETPEVYLEYADLSIALYRNFILGWFSKHITEIVTVIAVGQGLIAVGLLLKGWLLKAACLGIILFLLAIAPLGIGAGFPFSITTSIAAYIIYRQPFEHYIWQTGQPTSNISGTKRSTAK